MKAICSIFVLLVIFSGCSRSQERGHTMKIRKQVYHLTLEDFQKYPVWEFALDEEGKEGQDEATVRPYEFTGALDPSSGMFVVSARFGLADGSIARGYLTPPVQGDASIGTIQPHIITEQGQVMFWHGILKPDAMGVQESYRKLGRGAKGVFPLQYTSEVDIAGGPITGTLTGFLYREGNANREIR